MAHSFDIIAIFAIMNIGELYLKFLECGGVTTDTRNCAPGLMFFALKGERFNGNDYIQQALEQGCPYAVTDEPEKVRTDDGRTIVVGNVLKSLQELARMHREKLSPVVLGITGTNGKTTTKELVTAVLSKKFNVLSTKGNLNNSIGVPLTLLTLEPGHEIAVIEMGASHPGDIEELVEICRPDYGLISNVGIAHLQGFGSFEGVKRTKGELYDFIRRNGGSIFINGDNSDLKGMAGGLEAFEYGRSDCYQVSGRVIGCDPLLRISWKVKGGSDHTVRMNLTGTYNLDNILAAAAVGIRFGVDEDMISEALAGYVPKNNRSQITDTGRNRLVVDAYNANPTSMNAALDNFAMIAGNEGMLILGDMRELGGYSRTGHTGILERIRKEGYHEVCLVGHEFSSAAESVASDSWNVFEDTDALKKWLKRHCPEGRTILVKGSNSMKLTEVVELL